MQTFLFNETSASEFKHELKKISFSLKSTWITCWHKGELVHFVNFRRIILISVDVQKKVLQVSFAQRIQRCLQPLHDANSCSSKGQKL